MRTEANMIDRPFYMGIDIGSRYSKGVIAKGAEIVCFRMLPSGIDHRATAEELRQGLLGESGLEPEEISGTVSTGIGRRGCRFTP